LANAYRIKKNFTSAITQYIAALEIQEFVGEKRALCHFILGDIYAGQKEFSNAINQYTAALEIQKFVGEKRELCLTSLNSANDRKNGSVLHGAENFTPFDYIDEKMEDVWCAAAVNCDGCEQQDSLNTLFRSLRVMG
jgi:tetratricopeptide (TPR) repeat protein